MSDSTDKGPPDISDVEGATTGPLGLGESAVSGPDVQSDAWAAPSAEEIKEPAGSEKQTDEPAATVGAGASTAAERMKPAEETVIVDRAVPPPPPAADTGGDDDKTAPISLDGVAGETTQISIDSSPTINASPARTAPVAATTLAATPPPAPTVDPTSDIELSSGRPRRPKPGRRKPRWGRRIGLLVALLLAAFLGAWGIDSLRTNDLVMRNTSLGDMPIGGLNSEQLDDVIDGFDADLASAPLNVTVGDTEIATDPVSLGARLDRQSIKAEALAGGRSDNILVRPFNWLASFTSESMIEPSYLVDTAVEPVEAGVPTALAEALADPIEPGLTLRGSELAVDPGADGVTIDPAQLSQILPTILTEEQPYSIDLDPVATNPELTDDQIQSVVDDASEATDSPVVIRVLDKTAEVEIEALRSWVRLDAEGEQPTWAIDADVASEELKARFPALGEEGQLARFDVIDDEPTIIPASETVICCDRTSVEGLPDELRNPPPPPTEDSDAASDDADDDEEAEPILREITLEPEVVGSDEGAKELASLGIVEEVSTFTTNHPCCANRVKNIQRFADLTRGVVIRPGEDFSLNGHVGRRTIENGFAADGAIANGILEPQVGGGISQFATTFFNASFFAGVDFNEYQSHSLYISRYPRGREATISFPKPDLSVKNSTDYGILVWTSYTATSITVTFYSTKHIEVESLPLLTSSQSACTRNTTPRLRTYPDGTVVEDSVFAVYRPGEGFDCNGNSTRPEDDPAGPTAPAEAAPTETTPAETTPASPPDTPAPEPVEPVADPEPQPEPEPAQAAG